jgi:hypothetical protein
LETSINADRRVRDRRASLLIAAAMIALATASCRKHDTVVESGLTGINVSVNFSASLSLDALAFSATTANGAPAFAPSVLPDKPHQLNPSFESAVILVPAALGGTTVTLRVDGLRRWGRARADRAVRRRQHHGWRRMLGDVPDGGGDDLRRKLLPGGLLCGRRLPCARARQLRHRRRCVHGVRCHRGRRLLD